MKIYDLDKFDISGSDILFNPFKQQKEFFELAISGKYRFILYGGSIRSGKTFAGLATLIILCIFYPLSRWVVVRKDLQTIKKNTLPSWDKIKPESEIVSHNHDTQTVTFKNGSQIIFFGENFHKDRDFNRWRGLECNGFLLEEINELQEQSYFKSIERAGSYIIKIGQQPPPLILGTCNPTQGWVKERFYDKWKAGTLPKEIVYVPANIRDNPYVPKEYRDSLKDLPRYEYEVFVNGNWDVKLKSGGEFIKSFELDDHVAPANYDPEKTIHISLDENVHPYITLTIWQIKDKEIIQIGEILARHPNNTIIKLAKMFITWIDQFEYKDVIFIYGDRTSLKEDTKLVKGQNFFTIFESEIKKAGYQTRLRLPKMNPPVAISGNFINAIFENNFDDISILIGEHCKESINDYIDTKEASDGGILKIREKDSKTGITFEKNGHITDTMRYIICEAFKDSFRKFQSKSQFHKYITGNTRNIRK